MKEGGNVAAVYAQSLLDLAKESSQMEKVAEELGEVSALLSGDIELYRFFSSPVIAPEQKLAIIDSQLKPKISQLLYNFVGVLIGRRRVELLPEISTSYSVLLDRTLNRRRVSVRTHEKLSDAQAALLSDVMRKKLNADVILDIEEDPAMLGGIVVRSDDLLLDSSIRSNLHRIKSLLQKKKIIGEEYYEN